MTDRRPLLKRLAAVGLGTTAAVGWLSWPILTDLHSVAIENWRAEPIRLDVDLAANGRRVHRWTVDLAANDRTALPCAWPRPALSSPRPALSSRLTVRPGWTDEWHTTRFRGEGCHCSVTKIRPADAVEGPVDFEYTLPCPSTSAEAESCR